ncbi:MAG: exo-alpha-sialidase [Bacteroidota bacterium]|nr:exo-alpha-sialidase [Bacteroidota bacterium]
MKLFTQLICLFFCANTLWAQPDQEIKASLADSGFIIKDPAFAACHAATLVELPNNKLMAAWFAGPYESSPEVCIWLALYQNGQWSPPSIIADGIINDSLRYACWNPVLFRNKKGKLFLFYKVGKSPRDWWGMMKYSTDDGKSWSAPKQLPDGFLGPIKNKPIQLKNGNLLYPSSTESKDLQQWKIHVEKSDGNANHWQHISINCDSFAVIQPSILIHPNNKLQLLCRSKQNYIVQSWSTDNGKTWQPLSKTNLQNPNSGIDAVTLKNGLQLVVYNPLLSGKDWVNGRNKLAVAVSYNGIDWKNIYILEDLPDGEFSYPAVIQTNNGSVHIVYTYNRKNIKHVVLKIEQSVKQ